MATVVDLAGALEALNATRERLHLEESMPEITADNVDAIGVLPEDMLNKFMGMFNLVLQERYFKVMFDAEDNPFRAFLIDMREDGFGIRDVMQNIIDGVTPMWDNESDSAIAEDLVSYAGDNFEQKYHTKRIQKQFKTSVNRREFSKVFTAYGIVQYANNKVANLNTSAEYWLMTTVLDELKGRIENGELVQKNGFTLNNAQGIKDTIEQVKRVAKGAMMPTRLYNSDGILTKANSKEDLFLITTPEKLERIKAQVLAGTFNMGQLSLDNFTILEAPDSYDLGTVTVDDGGGESHTEDVLFVILDRKAFPVGIKTWVMRTFDVPNTLWINNWLSIEGVIGMNGFMTGVAFTGDYGDFSDSGDEPTPPTPAESKIAFTCINEGTESNNVVQVNDVDVVLSEEYVIMPGVTGYLGVKQVQAGDVIEKGSSQYISLWRLIVYTDEITLYDGTSPYVVTGNEIAINLQAQA